MVLFNRVTQGLRRLGLRKLEASRLPDEVGHGEAPEGKRRPGHPLDEATGLFHELTVIGSYPVELQHRELAKMNARRGIITKTLTNLKERHAEVRQETLHFDLGRSMELSASVPVGDFQHVDRPLERAGGNQMIGKNLEKASFTE